MPRLLSALALALTFAGPAVADDWPQWLGPKRDGVWRETGVATRFPKDLKPAWSAPVGAGYAGPAVAEGKVYLLDRVVADPSTVPADPFDRKTIPGVERVLCFDDATGELLWKHEYDCPYTISYPLGPRTTPVVAGGKVYTLGAMGNLLRLDAATGKVEWSRDFRKDYGIDAPLWGFSGHPLLDGDRLICLVGGQGSTVVAFDKETGKELWKAVSAKEPGYAPPVIYEAGGARQLIAFDAEKVSSLNPETGEVHWSEPIKSAFAMSIAMPRKSGDLLFLTSYQDASMMLRLADAKPAAEVLWRDTNRTSFRSTMMTPWVEGGYAYGCDSNGMFRCVKAETGERVWETLEPTTGGRPVKWGNAFVVKHEPTGTFFLFNELGDLIAADLSPQGYNEHARAHLLDPTSSAGGRDVLWSHPAFANKSVYARNDERLVKVPLAEMGK